MKIGSLGGWKGGRGRWGYPGDSSNEDRMRGSQKKGEERHCPLFSPPSFPLNACVTAEVCSLLLLFQPGGYLNPGQPSFLLPYLHRSFPSLLNSSFNVSLSIPLSRFLHYSNRLINHVSPRLQSACQSQFQSAWKKERGNDGGKERGKKSSGRQMDEILPGGLPQTNGTKRAQ